MADIQEIPLDIPEDIQNTTEIIQDNPEEIKHEEQPEIKELEVKAPIKPKAKGRPKGALNKGPSKPRAKKTQIQEAPTEEPAYEPSSPKRNLKIPTDPTTSEVAAAMLKLLQDQTYSRQSRKQRLYSSWFQ